MLYTVRDETNNAENVWKINSIYSQCNAYMWTHTYVLYFTSTYVVVNAADFKWAMAIGRFSRDKIQHYVVRWPR